MKRLLRLALVLGLPWPYLNAWDNATAHPQINLEAANLFLATRAASPKFQRAAINAKATYPVKAVTEGGFILASGFSNLENRRELDFTGAVTHGGFSADTPTSQALRHFYDPVAAAGASYLTDFYQRISNVTMNPMDAKTWATIDTDNPYRWAVAIDAYRRSFEDGEEGDRSILLATAFRALGETMHLVADMTLPAHVRNDGHPPIWPITDNDPVEMNVGIELVREFARGPVDERVSLKANNPELLMHNVAAFTNENFFSKDTIADAAYGLLPHNGRPAYPKPTLSELEWDEKHLIGSKRFTAGTVRMVQQTLLSYLARKANPAADDYYEIPDRYARDYARVLIPIAVAANVRLLDLFFPHLDLTMTCTPDVRDGQPNLRVGGRLAHLLAGDLVWAGKEIKYRGRSWVMLKPPQGGEDVPLAAVRFAEGEIVLADAIPLERVQGRTVYLQVEAGGRTFTSLPQTIAKGDLPRPEPPKPAGEIRVEISPESATLSAGETTTFAATLTGTSNPRVEWSASGGSIDAAGKYQAPATAGRYRVTATSLASRTKAATAVVTVEAAGAIRVTIEPAQQTVAKNSRVTFTPRVSGAPEDSDLQWEFGDGAIFVWEGPENTMIRTYALMDGKSSTTVNAPKLNTSSVTHLYIQPGSYTVTVSLVALRAGKGMPFLWPATLAKGTAKIEVLPGPSKDASAADIDGINRRRQQRLAELDPDKDPARLANKAAAVAAGDAIHANGEKFVCKNCKVEVKHWWTNGTQWQCPTCEQCTFLTDLRRGDGKTYGEFAQERIRAIQEQRKQVNDEADALIAKLRNQR